MAGALFVTCSSYQVDTWGKEKYWPHGVVNVLDCLMWVTVTDGLFIIAVFLWAKSAVIIRKFLTTLHSHLHE